jgi:hypothetical protein
MPRAEIAYRLSQSLRVRARRLATGRAQAVPAAVPSSSVPLASQRVSFFDVSLPYPGPTPIDWARDYKNGVSAPRIFYADVDYRDESQVGDSKYTWELNRHQFLVPWALEYQRTGEPVHAEAVTSVILHWIAENPRYLGMNWLSSLELGLRILAWGMALELCAAAEPVRRARPDIVASVAAQAAFIRHTLSLYSSANNHLMGELVGLLAAGAFFPEAPDGREYARFAHARLCREAQRQNHADGVNREQAIYYHHYTLEYILTAMALFGRLGWDTPAEMRALARRMLDFVDAMTDDHGRPFEIGDSDDGTVTGLNLGTGIGVYESLLWSGWLVYGDERLGAHAARIAASRARENEVPTPDRRSVYWHGEARVPVPATPRAVARRVFPEGGYFFSEDAGYTFMFKAGPFGYPSIAAHSHCDQLSIGLRHGDATVLTDAGTYVYHTEDRWRRHFRGTSAHNTVSVDGRDQAEYAGPFLWATHADARLEVLADGPGFEVRGSHDGYLRLPDPVQHERTVSYRPERGYQVQDRLRGTGLHTYELYWNFGTGVTLRSLSQEGGVADTLGAAWVVLLDERPILGFVVDADAPLTITTHEGNEDIPAGFQSRKYLTKEPIVHLRARAQAASCAFRTRVVVPPGEPTVASILSVTQGWS